MTILMFLIGGMCGVVTMSIFSASAYEKGWKDGRQELMEK